MIEAQLRSHLSWTTTITVACSCSCTATCTQYMHIESAYINSPYHAQDKGYCLGNCALPYSDKEEAAALSFTALGLLAPELVRRSTAKRRLPTHLHFHSQPGLLINPDSPALLASTCPHNSHPTTATAYTRSPAAPAQPSTYPTSSLHITPTPCPPKPPPARRSASPRATTRISMSIARSLSAPS